MDYAQRVERIDYLFSVITFFYWFAVYGGIGMVLVSIDKLTKGYSDWTQHIDWRDALIGGFFALGWPIAVPYGLYRGYRKSQRQKETT